MQTALDFRRLSLRQIAHTLDAIRLSSTPPPPLADIARRLTAAPIPTMPSTPTLAAAALPADPPPRAEEKPVITAAPTVASRPQWLSQCAPLQDGSHEHVPSIHSPWSPHTTPAQGSAKRSQCSPLQPSWHLHSPATHRPLPHDIVLQALISHASPEKPWSQSHCPFPPRTTHWLC